MTSPYNSRDFPPASLPAHTKLQVGFSMTEFTMFGSVFISLQLPNPSPALCYVITIQRQTGMAMERFPSGSCARPQTTIPRTIYNFSSPNYPFPPSPFSCSTFLCLFYLFVLVPTTYIKRLLKNLEFSRIASKPSFFPQVPFRGFSWQFHPRNG